jgi:hypothetical protein
MIFPQLKCMAGDDHHCDATLACSVGGCVCDQVDAGLGRIDRDLIRRRCGIAIEDRFNAEVEVRSRSGDSGTFLWNIRMVSLYLFVGAAGIFDGFLFCNSRFDAAPKLLVIYHHYSSALDPHL